MDYTIHALRKLIKYDQSVRATIIERNQKHLQQLISMVKIKNLHKITDELEKNIYQFLEELVRGDGRYKKIVGVDMKMFIDIFQPTIREMIKLSEEEEEEIGEEGEINLKDIEKKPVSN